VSEHDSSVESVVNRQEVVMLERRDERGMRMMKRREEGELESESESGVMLMQQQKWGRQQLTMTAR